MTAAKTRSILIKKYDGSSVIVDGIPSTAKITFGPFSPGKPTTDQYGRKSSTGDNTKALRIYTTAQNQLAVFLDVQSFRDLSLTVKERKTNVKLRKDATVGPNGKYTDDQYEETYEWVELEV